MKTFLTLVVLLALCGCGTPHDTADVTPGTPPGLSKDFRRVQDEAFSPRERDIIVSAQRHLAQSDRRPRGASEDAYYRVRHAADGYEVFVIYVTGYEGSQPLFTPCVQNEVFLRTDGTVRKVLSGPECWPSP